MHRKLLLDHLYHKLVGRTNLHTSCLPHINEDDSPMSNTYNLQDAAEARSSAPRVFRQLRRRTREHLEGDIKGLLAGWTGEERMEEESVEKHLEDTIESKPIQHVDRATLCLPNFSKQEIVHGGDEGFKDVLRQFFPAAESNATERLVDLKYRLRNASTHDFWTILMEEMCDITGAQCGLVAKRMLVDAQDSAVEMPELGEPGSCLMGVAFYINNGADVKEFYSDYRYHAYGTPCAHMKHDKVFIIPERLKEVIPDNPNKMPWEQSESFIGIPLFAEGKCFAHFSLIWSTEGASRRKLGWSYIEMFMHSLEDLILQRILEGKGFVKDLPAPDSATAQVIPLSAISASQSLKPYARSLSHELRTPMQGVVGMLDIMYSTVLEAILGQENGGVRETFEQLKNHIEVVQDSSKRAVEAADNVVHAYAMNMQMPETPLTPDELATTMSSGRQSPDSGGVRTSLRGQKRSSSEDVAYHSGPPLKKMFSMTDAEIARIYYTKNTLDDAASGPSTSVTENGTGSVSSERPHSARSSSTILYPTHRRIVVREFLRSLLSEALRSDHPTREIHTETPLGEKIEITTSGSRGEPLDRTIYLEVAADVPEIVITEEQHLQFSLRKVIDNAIKFTESGSITIAVRLRKNPQLVEVSVVDTGCGIAEESRQDLFKPHFQQDSSISRSKDGLGLSLFNAKAHVRKNLGGDVVLERSETTGPAKGSEFMIRLPMTTIESDSDVPIVGTPPAVSHQPGHHSPWFTSPNIPAGPVQVRTTSPPKSSISEEALQTPTKRPARKRVAFNPNLATDYPLNILIAEDNAINRNVAIGSLKKLGYTDENITTAFNGEEAVQHYKGSLTGPPEKRFNAILMDIWMPKMDGYEATRNIMQLAHSNGQAIAIVAVTADITGEALSRATEIGMCGFLPKPYKVLDMERLIMENFPRRKGE